METILKPYVMTDHQLAKFLRDNDAIDNYKWCGDSVAWRDSNGDTVAMCIYDNGDCTKQTWLNETLVK